MIRPILGHLERRRWNGITRGTHFSTQVGNDAEITPFNFEDIDRLVKEKRNGDSSYSSISEYHRNLFYSLVRYSRAIKYHRTKIGMNDAGGKNGKEWNEPKEREGDTPCKLPAVYDIYRSGEEACEKMAKNLGYMNKSMLIVIFQQSLSTHHYTRKKCWYSLSTSALRYCFLDEPLTCRDLVKICSSLSKWRIRKLDEFVNKIDAAIVFQPEWNIHDASQILWSLAHLKLFTIPSFNYLNSVIARRILTGHIMGTTHGINEWAENGEQRMSEWEKSGEPIMNEYIKDEDVHRIASANLMRASQVGIIHPILQSIVGYFSENSILLKCTSTKTMVALVSLLPYSPYNDALVVDILERLVQSLYQYTHAQASHIIYKLAVIHSDLSETARDLTLELLLLFRNLVLSSDITFIPSASSKLLYTYKAILGAHDVDFVNKCLSDLNANLHLLGPFSLFGNLLCLGSYSHEAKLEAREKESIMNTRKNLLKFDDGGHICKTVDGELVPLENVKLWHYGLLSSLEKGYDVYDHLFEFMNSFESNNAVCNVKNFALFLLHLCWNECSVHDPKVLNSILITSHKLVSSDDHYGGGHTNSGHSMGSVPSTRVSQRGTDVTTTAMSRAYSPARSPLNSLERERIWPYWLLIKYHLTVLDLMPIFEREMEFNIPISSLNRDALLISLLIASIRNKEDAVRAHLEELAKRFSDGKIGDSEPLVVKTVLLLDHVYSGGKLAADLINADTFVDTFYGPVPRHKFCKSHSSVPHSHPTSHPFDHHSYIHQCLLKNVAPVPLEWVRTRTFFLQDYPEHFFRIIPLALVGNMFSIRNIECSAWDVAKWFKAAKGWDYLHNYLKNLGVPDDSSIHDQLHLGYTNCNFSPVDITSIATAIHVGPYLCQFVMNTEGSSQSFFVFVLSDHPSEHLYHRIRRDILNKFGCNFVELTSSL